MTEMEQRLAALENRVTTEASLRASVDRDLADLAQSYSAQSLMIQALGITSSQHNAKLAEHTAILNAHTASLRSAHDKLDVIVELLHQLTEGDAS